MSEISNWDFHSLRMDFHNLARVDGSDKPSDIDMVYLSADNTLIIGEIKNERGELKPPQRRLLEAFINGWNADGMAIYITHDKYVQKGDKIVDVSECYVQEIYYKRLGRWTQPHRPTKVKEIISYYRGGKNELSRHC